MTKKNQKKCQKNTKKKLTRKPKKYSTDRNTEAINVWRLALCIIFCALFDGGKLWGRSLNDSGPFEKNVKYDEKQIYPETNKTQYRPED